MKPMNSKLVVDLRSDTVTWPGPQMRKAMAVAAVGDDVFGEDPTINQLQAMAAKVTGKEAALFMASGTMSNEVAIKTHTRPGESAIVGEGAHTYIHEAGGLAAISGVTPFVAGRGGAFTCEEFVEQIKEGDIHYPATSLVMVENTHNGIIFPLEDIAAICKEARRRGIKSHLDGARVFNAAIAMKISAKEICKHFDSVSFCLSKGLGAPVGSMLCGSKKFIAKALGIRKMLGGGMRQAGILAAAGIYALKHNIHRLADDHKRARRLAEALSGLPGVELDLSEVQTNMVIFRVEHPKWDAEALVLAMSKKGVLMLPMSKDSVRTVTHLDVSDQGIERAIKIFRGMLGRQCR
jgi:threonine aldolase